jgi:hypothetical protein
MKVGSLRKLLNSSWAFSSASTRRRNCSSAEHSRSRMRARSAGSEYWAASQNTAWIRFGESFKGVVLALSATFHAPFAAEAVEKKADVAEHPEVFDHAGLLVNEPPDPAGLPFI